ncbi:MAG: hypothetical protein ACYCTW_04280 [Sulfuricella sp.]
MNPIPELSPQLKQLRLSGILDSLEARNRQASAAKKISLAAGFITGSSGLTYVA